MEILLLFLLVAQVFSRSLTSSLPFQDDKESLCVLSHSISNLTESGFFGYPLEYYASSKRLVSSNTSVPCKANPFMMQEIAMQDNDPYKFVNLSCSNICPMKENHVDAFTRQPENFRQNQYNVFCPLYETLKNKLKKEPKKEIRVIVLGGSVTEGYRTEGCKVARMDEVIFERYGYDGDGCSYSAYLYRWLAKEASRNEVTVRFKRVTLGGWTTQVMSELLYR